MSSVELSSQEARGIYVLAKAALLMIEDANAREWVQERVSDDRIKQGVLAMEKIYQSQTQRAMTLIRAQEIEWDDTREPKVVDDVDD